MTSRPQVLEFSTGLLGFDLDYYSSKTSLTPQRISQSITASPTRGLLTPGQRGVQREQNHARHYSKQRSRSQRAGGGFSLDNITTGTSNITGHNHQCSSDGQVRSGHHRSKPQCWEHGCDGRQFSTLSNLHRHQREKSGQATKATCPECGAEFTRTTARNGHLQHGKCKTKLNSNTTNKQQQ